ncbi:MAG: hypothetical protein J07HQW2_00745 [Haloquadratum walsbyi J07HQW2]|uniref:Uncharacterized protein n=1 Tax=Haloquadratum walsbyi J07HQW2 TaxID=1238425 RepID=U1PPS2_9EURY|nr:MAG: hypothetical protein J07HQW2_00745 [Haloquadratum walsbyi J07HQW2]
MISVGFQIESWLILEECELPVNYETTSTIGGESPRSQGYAKYALIGICD